MISSTFSSLARFWRIANKSSDMMAIAGVAGQLVFRPVLYVPLNVNCDWSPLHDLNRVLNSDLHSSVPRLMSVLDPIHLGQSCPSGLPLLLKNSMPDQARRFPEFQDVGLSPHKA
jgi:hypothetical protein